MRTASSADSASVPMPQNALLEFWNSPTTAGPASK